MANHASAEKRNRQRLKKTARNRAAKSTLRTTVKKARVAITGGTDGAVALQTAASALDRAASKGVIPAKRAARTQSRLAAALHKASVAAKA